MPIDVASIEAWGNWLGNYADTDLGHAALVSAAVMLGVWALKSGAWPLAKATARRLFVRSGHPVVSGLLDALADAGADVYPLKTGGHNLHTPRVVFRFTEGKAHVLVEDAAPIGKAGVWHLLDDAEQKRVTAAVKAAVAKVRKRDRDGERAAGAATIRPRA